jgi:hypothetical protein
MRDNFADHFEDHLHTTAAELGNNNLDLGQIEGEQLNYPLAVKTFRRWQGMLNHRDRAGS